MPKKCAFLDTTILKLRQMGIERQKKELKTIIGNKVKHTSTYVKMELNRTFLLDAVFLHDLLMEERNLNNVYRRLTEFPVTPRRRIRCLELLSRISGKLRFDVNIAIARLENLLTEFDVIFLDDISVIVSGTECPLSYAVKSVESAYEVASSMTCRRDAPPCRIVDYLLENKQQLKNLHTNVAQDKEFAGICSLLTRWFEEPLVAKGRNCMILGDIIICLDSPKKCSIVSTNVKHFELICKSLGKDFIQMKLS